MSQFSRIKQRVKIFSSEPLLLSILLTIFWISIKLRSYYYSRLFRTKDLNIGPSCSIKGIRNILMGRGISIHSGLWLEAVTQYRGQSFSPLISIGNNVAFSRGVHITCIQFISIGKNVLFGSNIYVSDHNHGCYSGEIHSMPDEPPAERKLIFSGPVVIEDNVWIGDNVVIVGPVRVGEGSILAANSVIKKDVKARTIVAGIPAKPIKKFNSESNIWVRI